MLHEQFDAYSLHLVLSFTDQQVEAPVYRGTNEWSHHHGIQVCINSSNTQKLWIWLWLVTRCYCTFQMRGQNSSLQRPSTPTHRPPQGLLYASGTNFMLLLFLFVFQLLPSLFVFFNTLAANRKPGVFLLMQEKKTLIILPIVFLLSECILIGLVWQCLSCRTPAGRMEFFPSLLTQGEGGVPLLPCHWAEWDSATAWLEISAAAGCCVCQRPVSCSWSLQTHWRPSDVLSAFLFWMTLTLSPSLSLASPIQAVVGDFVQWDAVLRLDPPSRCGLSRGEGQTGLGEWTGGGEEKGSQTHRNGGRQSWWLCVLHFTQPQLLIFRLLLPEMSSVGPPALNLYWVHSKQSGSDADYSCSQGRKSNLFVSVVAILAWHPECGCDSWNSGSVSVACRRQPSRKV